jgi:hypothetical protein
MRHHCRTFHAGLLAAVLAATLQFVLLAGSLSGAFAESAAQAGIAQAGQCHDTPGNHTHNDAACALCPVCLSITLPGLLPPYAPAVPPPAVRAMPGPTPLPPAQFPPARVLAAAYPRGPPLI